MVLGEEAAALVAASRAVHYLPAATLAPSGRGSWDELGDIQVGSRQPNANQRQPTPTAVDIPLHPTPDPLAPP